MAVQAGRGGGDDRGGSGEEQVVESPESKGTPLVIELACLHSATRGTSAHAGRTLKSGTETNFVIPTQLLG
eukprot:15432770-Alexandrium_andersonii.AAC.1